MSKALYYYVTSYLNPTDLNGREAGKHLILEEENVKWERSPNFLL